MHSKAIWWLNERANISQKRSLYSAHAEASQRKESSIFDVAKKMFKALGFVCVFHTNRSPGLAPLWAFSSSSKAAKTADLAKLPVRVVVGSAKSILQCDKEKYMKK